MTTELGAPSALRPGLSVLTAAWNHAGFLPAAVASALACLDRLSSSEQGEVLVLDDASTDETPDVLAGLVDQDPRVRAVRAPQNLGISTARKVLLHLAPTEHALVLDADNTAEPGGVAAVFATARDWRSAFTYGNVIMTRADGTGSVAASQEPVTEDYFFASGPHVDTLGVIDVRFVRAIGGYNVDPVVQGFEDHELIHRIARRGGLLGFVPVVAGHYRVDALSDSANYESHDVAVRRLRRAYGQDGRLRATPPASFAAHPVTGPLWATPAAVAARPLLANAAAAPA